MPRRGQMRQKEKLKRTYVEVRNDDTETE